MSVLYDDFVYETTTTAGTGTLDLDGAVAGFRSFVAAAGNGARVTVSIEDGTDFEVFVGTLTDASPDTLSRDIVLSSSNSNDKVSWGVGTRDVRLVRPAESAMTPEHISGLVITNGTDADHDIDIAVGKVRDDDDEIDIVLASALTKQIDAAWVAGSAAGGMFTGAVANDTLYYIHLIREDEGGAIDAGFDTSETAANIPAGYTAFRLIGKALTNGSANIIAGVQSESTTGKPLLLTSVKSGAYSAVDGELVRVDASGGNIAITLPAPIEGVRVGLLSTVAQVANTITAGAADGETINGNHDDILYIKDDFLVLIADGTDWQTTEDGLQAHSCVLKRSAAQSISNATLTKIAFDGEDFDKGEIGDFTTNDRIDIRRGGVYDVSIIMFYTGIGSGTLGQTYLYINGVEARDMFSWSAGSSGGADARTSMIELDAGDYLELQIFHNAGSAQNTQTGDEWLPRLGATEARR